MRKGLTIAGALFIIIIVFSETVLPWLAQETLQTRMSERLATHDAQVSVDSRPGFLLALGVVQHVHGVAHQAKVGQVYFREISLTGENVRLNVQDLWTAGKVAMKSADKLTLTGSLDEENLREVLTRKLERIDNVQVTIEPTGIMVTADTKVFGRTVDIEMEGNVVEEAGSLYFQMTHLAMKNSRFGTAKLNDMFGNIQLAAPGRLPLGMQFQNVRQTQGAIVITAGLDNVE
ncbi:LmeA family phospholipid-binding protein [Selenomonas ruminantium]|uniref:LmeA family phospholipid-binding protein n=1 Tax=Selenomonas ruminantium TaxID=971 RepID=UPI0013157094|nr:LmeA family phospholipid-binding protein [Selenomonas ruminantium]